MNKFFIKLYIASFVLFSISSCQIQEQVDPNKPNIEDFEEDANSSQLNNLVAGVFYQMRVDIGTYYDAVGVIGREIYRFSGSDPRYVADLLTGTLDNNAFYTTRPFTGRYKTVKNCNILIDAVSNTTSSTVTVEDKHGYLALAKTMKANEFLMVLNQLYDNGIRLDVDDPDNLGPFVNRGEALTAITALLDEALEHLDEAGDDFSFNVPSGFADFSTPSNFKKFVNALAARVAVYNEKFQDALDYLNNSFMDLNGDYQMGAYHVFSTGSGDLTNPLFLPLNNSGEVRTAHPDWVNLLELNDSRRDKIEQRDEPFSNSDLTGEYDVWLYQSNTAPIPIIKNEELVFLYIEANIQLVSPGDALVEINKIRSHYGLGPYVPIDINDEDEMINEMLLQKFLSLWFEGHRWVDMRRYNKLDELPLDRPGDKVHVQFPIPFSEGV